jgi:hypothetical protein
MLSDIVAYGVLASIFVVNGLRMLIKKHIKTSYSLIGRLQRKRSRSDALDS